MLRLAALQVLQAHVVPFLVDRGARPLQARLGGDDLHRVFIAVVDAEVVAVGEVAQARVIEIHVVDLEIGLDEGLPVDVVFIHAHRVEHVAAEVPVGRGGDLRQIPPNVAWAGEQQAVPVGERCRVQLDARRLREVRRAEQLAFQVVGPAVQRADDVLGVAAAFEHDRLAVAADVRQQPDSLGAANQHLRVVGPGERVVVAGVGHHQLVPDVVRSGVEQELFLLLEDLGIEVPGHRQLRACRPDLAQARYVRHSL